MIKAFLIFNNHGKPRISKFYESFTEDMKTQVVRECFQLLSRRADDACSFLEGGELLGGKDSKIIYRHYATLYFVVAVDSSESELGILDLIQVFVEALDKDFGNVCELDIVFHFDRIHHILDEMIMGGMVMETNMIEMLTHIEAQDKLLKQEGGSLLAGISGARAAAAVKAASGAVAGISGKIPFGNR